MTVLEISDLYVRFGEILAVRGISLTIERGQTHCLVGESGCGKSVTALATMGLLARGGVRTATRLQFQGADIAALDETAMSRLRGDKMAMIFQEPMTSLNPAYTVGSQMAEVLRRHRRLSRRAALGRAAELLARVGITAPGLRLGQFPHQLSGGLRQRVMIAMALLCDPELLIADEPTTALDTTIQAQILDLLRDIQRATNMALVLISHDLGVVADLCARVGVMYAGRIVEQGPAESLFAAPAHPYTNGLLGALPEITGPRRRLTAIPGGVPEPWAMPPGCAFAPRCDLAGPDCAVSMPGFRSVGGNHHAACLRVPAPACA